ncbi:hypothetical protein GGI07_000311 [Coemansia sp. Benny D115]|nr:hypothetical protein GGI07_000311 [Coemansia sp. Benny D115]
MPPKRPRNLRSATKSLADWDDTPADNETNPADEQPSTQIHPEENSDTNKVDLTSLLEYQRLRRHKQKGIDSEVLSKGDKPHKHKHQKHKPKPSTDTTTAADQGPDTEPTKTTSMSRSLDGAFTVQTNKLDADKHMMEFIEREMEKHRGTKEPTNNQTDQMDDLDDPFYMPKHLQSVEHKPVKEGNVAMAAKMLTSIQEVDLGRESKLRNIRDTDRMVAQLRDQKSTPEFTQHTQRYSASNKRRQTEYSDNTSGGPLGESGSSSRYSTQGSRSDRSSKATDDIVLQRFKKRMRR